MPGLTEIGMIVFTLLLVAGFMLYQVGQSRRRVRELADRSSRTRGGRSREHSSATSDKINELQSLRDAGKIDEQTYYEVLRRLQSLPDRESFRCLRR